MQCILDSSPRNRELVNEEHWGTAIKVKPNFASVIPDADLSIQWLATNFLEPSIIAGALASLAHDPSAVIIVGTGGHWGLPENLDRNVFSSSLTWAELGKEKTKQIMANRLLPTFALLKSFAKSHIVSHLAHARYRTLDREKNKRNVPSAARKSRESLDVHPRLPALAPRSCSARVAWQWRARAGPARAQRIPTRRPPVWRHETDHALRRLSALVPAWNAILINYLCQHQQQRR